MWTFIRLVALPVQHSTWPISLDTDQKIIYWDCAIEFKIYVDRKIVRFRAGLSLQIGGIEVANSKQASFSIMLECRIADIIVILHSFPSSITYSYLGPIYYQLV